MYSLLIYQVHDKTYTKEKLGKNEMKMKRIKYLANHDDIILYQ